MKPEEIDVKRINRFKVLHEAYIAGAINSFDIRSKMYELGLRNGIFEEAFNYNVNEGFLDGFSSSKKYIGKISHSGIKTIEKAILNPSEPTEHFPPFNEMGLG